MNKRNLLIILLIASVAVNLLLIGGIGWRIASARQFVQLLIPPNTSWIVQDLAEDRRAELEPIMRESFEPVSPARTELFRAQRRVNELIGNESFDREALEDALAQLRERNMDYQALSHEQTLEILGRLTLEERRAVTEFVRRGGSPRADRDGPRGRDLPRRPPEPDLSPRL